MTSKGLVPLIYFFLQSSYISNRKHWNLERAKGNKQAIPRRRNVNEGRTQGQCHWGKYRRFDNRFHGVDSGLARARWETTLDRFWAGSHFSGRHLVPYQEPEKFSFYLSNPASKDPPSGTIVDVETRATLNLCRVLWIEQSGVGYSHLQELLKADD